MPEQEDVQLVVPTRAERLDLLDISIRSILDQTYPVRVTVVAPPAAQAMLRDRYGSAAKLDVTAERQKGLSAAINQAWRDDKWSSTVTGWLGDDDALPPDSVRHAVEALRTNPRAVMVHGRCLMIDQHGAPLWVARNGWLAGRLAGYGINLIAQPGCLFRTAAVKELDGLDESLTYAMDVELYARLRRLGPVASTRHQLGVFREHPDGLSTAGKAAAAKEARRAQRRVHRYTAARVADLAAVPLCSLIGRTTARLPWSASGYWRPARASRD
ncbi:MAG TPA: glycosyltransferase [Mycobacteriales bacterium]|nr:glycosyltransferase [Mycobacteriales bacterium]